MATFLETLVTARRNGWIRTNSLMHLLCKQHPGERWNPCGRISTCLFCAARTTYVRAYQDPEQLAAELERALKELIGDDRRSAAAVPQDRHSWCPFYYFMADKLVDNAAVREALAYAEPVP